MTWLWSLLATPPLLLLGTVAGLAFSYWRRGRRQGVPGYGPMPEAPLSAAAREDLVSFARRVRDGTDGGEA